MKRLMLTLLILLSSAAAVRADSIQLDKTFENAQKWLDSKNLNLTGGPDGARDDAAAFSQGDLLFYGEASGNPTHVYPGQREIMAKRAAVVVAQRAVAEYLSGFALAGNTEVKDGMASSDAIRSAVISFVKGSHIVYQEYSAEKNTAIAIIKIGMRGPRGMAATLYNKIFGDPKVLESIKSDGPEFKPAPAELASAPPATVTPAAIPAQPAVDTSYDGLIINATAQNFRPALINRICTTKGEILYDPAKISQKVLVEQGCGEYSNSVDKAKADLATRGVKNPLIVTASGIVTAADLQVSDNDASTIFTANQKEGFFAAAKVAFVVK